MAIRADPRITRGRILVADREAFAKQLRIAISAKYPSVNAAASHLKMKQPVLSRLLNKKHASIAAATWQKLQRLIGEDQQTLSAVLPPFAQRARRTWCVWVTTESDRILGSNSDRVRRTKRQDLRALRRRMEKERSLSFIVSKLEQFPNEDRAELARRRILEPLLQAHESGWVERNGWELTTSEFCHFVRAGWKREEILLRREGEIPRSQKSMVLSLGASAARMGRDVQLSGEERAPRTSKFQPHVPITLRISKARIADPGEK